MATDVCVKDDGERVLRALEEARQKLASSPAEVVVDFSFVRRITSGAVRAMEDLANAVDGNGTKLILSNVNIDIYKVLKLTKVAPRFAFRT